MVAFAHPLPRRVLCGLVGADISYKGLLVTDTAPAWLITARVLKGTDEAPGSLDNPTILGWSDVIARTFPSMATYSRGYNHDAIAWCGHFAAYCVAANGIAPPFGASDTDKYLWAKAWAKWGTRLLSPTLGCVMVFQRSGGGHVAFYERESDTHYYVTGGNQSDTVSTTAIPKGNLVAMRWPPEPQKEVTPMPVDGWQRNIVATWFGGVADPNYSAYDNHFIDDTELGVALPYRFSGARPKVRVRCNGRECIAFIVDVGPWNTNDDYWADEARPQSETGVDTRGRTTNSAGIDLTPGVIDALGLSRSTGKWIVDWGFADAVVQPPVVQPPVVQPPVVQPPIITPPITEPPVASSDLDRVLDFIANNRADIRLLLRFLGLSGAPTAVSVAPPAPPSPEPSTVSKALSRPSVSGGLGVAAAAATAMGVDALPPPTDLISALPLIIPAVTALVGGMGGWTAIAGIAANLLSSAAKPK